MREFSGEFEIHLTLTADAAPDAEDRLLRWAERHRVKYTRILLDRGATPDQPMLTVPGRGTLSAQRTAARAWTERLSADGFTVTRVKIEAAPWNTDVPRTAAEAAALPHGCYFEHHVKLVLADTVQLASIRAAAERHTAHVSRNARRDLGEHGHERFVTQRCRGVGRPEARRRLDALVSDLVDAGFPVKEVEAEFVVHDDGPDLDRGWIDESRDEG